MNYSVKSLCLLLLICNCYLTQSQSVEFYISKGKDANNNEEYNLAVYYFNLALEEDSISFEAYDERGLSYFNLGRYRESMKDYEKAISINSSLPYPYYGIGSIKAREKNYYEAINFYTISIEKSLEIGDTLFAGASYFIRGSTKGDLGDNNGKMEDYEKAAKLGDKFAKMLLQLYKSIE